MRLVRTLGLLLFAVIAGVSQAAAQIAVAIVVAPPILPVYVQCDLSSLRTHLQCFLPNSL